MRYVALLGSINVGGNRLKMAELRAALEDEGFGNVSTVVASGNVLFDHSQTADAKLEARIAKIVKDRFDIDSFAAVRNEAELERAIDDNPFVADGEARFVHTIFLSDGLDRGAFERFARDYPGPERLAAGEREFFVDYCEGVARSQLDPAMRKAKVVQTRATARNVRSLRRILEKMRSGG